jgi:hypothetical protein
MIHIHQNPQFLLVKSKTPLIANDTSPRERLGLVSQNIETEENMGATSVRSGNKEKRARIGIRVLEEMEESGGGRRWRD